MAKNKATLRIRNRQYEESLEPSGNAFARKLTLDDEMEMITEATVYTKENSPTSPMRNRRRRECRTVAP